MAHKNTIFELGATDLKSEAARRAGSTPAPGIFTGILDE